ncbi:MAG: BrnA antitoxin family protein [Planctomycetota bacterium]|jgi:hypothetical protein|nr:BrnA antitoxin family protein [Planctomycetota bacterium]
MFLDDGIELKSEENMPTTTRSQKVKFATQADPDVLETLRSMAGKEGRRLQTLIDEALREYIERKQGLSPRKHVMQALQTSMARHDGLYRKLAE